MQMGFPNDSKVKNPPAILEAQETQVRSLGWEDPLRRRQPSPVFLESSSGDFHEQRSLVCYSSWGPKESDETKQLNTHTQTHRSMQIWDHYVIMNAMKLTWYYVILYDITYMWNLKKRNDTNELMYKTETDPQTEKTNLRLSKRKEGRDKLGTLCVHTLPGI